MAIQKLLIRLFLEPLSRIMGKLGEKGRQGLFLIAGIGIFVCFFLNHMRVLQWRALYSFVLCSGLLAVMLLATLPREIKPVKFNPLFAVCWFGAAGFIFLSGILNNTDYLTEALLMLIAYPIVYICWNNCDREYIFKLLLKLCKISVIIFFIASFLFAQITARRYDGIFTNVNNCAFYIALAGICLLAEILYNNHSVIGNIFNIVLFGMCYGMVDLTNSRTGKLALLCAAAIGTVLYFITYRAKLKKMVVIYLAGCVLVSAVMPSCLLSVFNMRQYLNLPYYSHVSSSLYYINDRNPGDGQEDPSDGIEDPSDGIEDPSDGIENPSDGIENPSDGFEDPSEGVEDPAQSQQNPGFVENIDIDSFNQVGNNKNNMDGKTIDQFSTGRISIWWEYLQRLKLFGVAQKEPVYLEGYDVYIKTTHMTVLEIAYESGIFAGIFYLMMNLLSGVFAIVYAWRKRNEKYALMPLMVILVFGVISAISSTKSSYNYMTTFYYYLVLFPVIVSSTKNVAKK